MKWCNIENHTINICDSSTDIYDNIWEYIWQAENWKINNVFSQPQNLSVVIHLPKWSLKRKCNSTIGNVGLITTIFAVFYSFQVLTASNFVHSISNRRMQVLFLTKDRGLTRCIRWSSFQEVFDLKVGR